MTIMMRDSVKKMETFNIKGQIAALFFLISCFVVTQSADAVTTKRMWSSPITGYAIDGYDPVAYFTDAEPRKGHVEFEFIWRGVAWHFVNEGNLDAFKRNPEIYAPQLGGYGAGGILKNLLLPPNPLQWALYDKKLYFFNSAKAKKGFEKKRAANLLLAAKNWKLLLMTLEE